MFFRRDLNYRHRKIEFEPPTSNMKVRTNDRGFLPHLISQLMMVLVKSFDLFLKAFMTSDGRTPKTRVAPLMIFHSQLWGVFKACRIVFLGTYEFMLLDKDLLEY